MFLVSSFYTCEWTKGGKGTSEFTKETRPALRWLAQKDTLVQDLKTVMETPTATKIIKDLNRLPEFQMKIGHKNRKALLHIDRRKALG